MGYLKQLSSTQMNHGNHPKMVKNTAHKAKKLEAHHKPTNLSNEKKINKKQKHTNYSWNQIASYLLLFLFLFVVSKQMQEDTTY